MIKEIEIKGKKYPVKVSFNAEKHLQMEYGISIDGIKDNFAAIEPLFYYSIESGCAETGQEFDIKRADVPFILDDCYVEFLMMIADFGNDTANTIKKKDEKGLNLDQLFGIACARLGLNLKEFYSLCRKELDEALTQKAKNDDERYKFEMECMRIQTFYLLSPNLHSDIKHPSDLMKFNWDKKEEIEILEMPNWEELDKQLRRG